MSSRVSVCVFVAVLCLRLQQMLTIDSERHGCLIVSVIYICIIDTIMYNKPS